MKTKLVLFFTILVSIAANLSAQSYPWERPLRIAWSNDGKIFSNSEIYQDSSGVPSAIRWKGDTLICAFQWFRVPINSPSWDRVAVKFSYDNGLTWTAPTPIIINGIPPSYQRAFDPTLTAFGKDSIRIYYSCSDGIPKMGVDSIINTYSAKSADGIHYSFEPGARVDEPLNRVIDPAVIYFKNLWHYVAPVGSPQQGAYHYISQNGLNYSAVPLLPSDNMHNWTGNFMVKDTNELRYYGSGQFVWYNSSSNGGMWNGFVNTNVQGGDPSVVKIADNNYLMIFVGNPYLTSVQEYIKDKITISPNPVDNWISIDKILGMNIFNYKIFSSEQNLIDEGITQNYLIPVKNLPSGIYLLILQSYQYNNKSSTFKFIKI